MEIFVPYAMIDGYDADSAYIPAGFAFKTLGEQGFAWATGDYWYVPEADPGIRNVFITDNGIMTGSEKKIDGDWTDWSESAYVEKKVYAEDIQFDWDCYCDSSMEQMKPAAAAIFEFADLPVIQIDITIRNAGGSDSMAISEIMILGKDEACDPVSEIGAYGYTNPAFPSPEIFNHSATFGDVGSLKTMWGYDLSHDDGTENAYIEQNGNYDQYAYFKDINSTEFYVEAEITVTNSTPFASDAYPKFGIQVSCEENTIFFYVDADVSYTQKRVGCAQRKLDNSDWDWTATEKLYDVPNMVYSGGSYVKMAVYRDGDMFYYYINDQLIVAYNKFNVFNDT